MQVNSINSTTFKSLYNDYKEESEDIVNSYQKIKSLKNELLQDKFDKDETEVKPKSVFGIVGSVLFAAGASYVLSQKAYNGFNKLVQKVKNDDIFKKVFENEKFQNALNTVKDKASTLTASAKDKITNAIPEKLKSNGVVNFLKSNKLTTTVKNFKPQTKIGLAGAAAGTLFASKVDGNGDGESDMFQKGISWVDGVAKKADSVLKVVRAVS